MASKCLKVFIGSLALSGAALLAATASAAAMCPASESFFGTIERVNGSMLTLQTPAGRGADVRIENNARVNTNGNSMRPGTFAGVYGCVERSGVFVASEVTLSRTQSSYNESVSGTVQQVQSDRILVEEQMRHTSGWWYVPNASQFTVGETVTGVGFLGTNGAFYPQSVNSHGVAFTPMAVSGSSATITLTGTVRSVNSSHTMIVWEAANHTTGTWVIPNAARFHTGERVSARGTEDRHGRFYVQEITIL
jgi:hypothetical protein